MNSSKYIWQHPDWPHWHFDAERLSRLLPKVHHAQGQLLGRMQNIDVGLRNQITVQTLTEEVVKTSEIENEFLNPETVKSSIAHRLGVDAGAVVSSDQSVDGVVDMVLDATGNFEQPLTEDRLFSWHKSLFLTGYSGKDKINVGAWRDDALGPMLVVGARLDKYKEKVHYEAPPAELLTAEVSAFLRWYNATDGFEPIIKAGLAHLWLVTLHPFDDGNGRISRAVGDMTLARADQSPQRFYSLSAQIQQERKDYYKKLELTQKGTLDVTDWLVWFLGCLLRAIQSADKTLSAVLTKARFWQHWANTPMNERQIKLLNALLDGFQGNLTSSKCAKIAKCSPDTALRDITNLLNHGILLKSDAGSRSTSYKLAPID